MKTHLTKILAAFLVVTIPAFTIAQDQPPQEGEDTKVQELEKKLAEVTSKLDEQQQKIEQLEKAKEEAPLEADADAMDEEEMAYDDMGELEGLEGLEGMEGMEGMGDGGIEESSLKIYGFFDLGFKKGFYDDDSAFNLFLPVASSFMMTNLNLYISSQMSENIGALVELRFTFLPLGNEIDYGYVGKIGDNEIVSGEYQREDTVVFDSATTMEYNLGGVAIERVHLTYTPVDWLNIIAGRYLTPYGIWNIDHGSPVIIAVVTPYMQTRRMIPLAQTGLQVYGRFYPRYDLFLDYAVTLSNGRGPIDSVLDLDENKGVGLRLRLSYEGDNITVAAGGYGYIGKYTDSSKDVVMELQDDLTIRTEAEYPLSTHLNKLDEYSEYIVSADFLLKLWGVHFQSEVIYKYVDTTVPSVQSTDSAVFSGASVNDTLYSASYTGLGYYFLLGWALPLDKWIAPVIIMPYAIYEYNASNDTLPYLNFKIVTGGINVKPSPFVTLKGEFMVALPENELYGPDNMKVISAQMAVSF